MKRVRALSLAGGLVCIAITAQARADPTYFQIDSLSVALSENFDSLGNAGNGLLPPGWHVGFDLSFFTGRSHTDASAGTTGSGALTSSSLGGFYNFGDGENLTATDRSVGFLTAFNSPQDKNLIVGLFNNSGSTITDLQISYDIEKYRSGIRSNDIDLFYAFDGINWTKVADGLQHFDGDPATAVVNPPTSVTQTIHIANLSVADQSAVYLRWFYTAVVKSDCQALGIDNFQLSFQQPDLQWDGGLGANWDAANTNWKNTQEAHVVWNDSMPNNANFIDGGGGVGTFVNLPSPRHAGKITFDAGAKSYTLSGSALELSGSGGIGILAKSNALIQSELQITSSQSWDISSTVTISGPLTLSSNATLTKKGAGTVVLSGQQTIAANAQIKVTEGTLRLAANLGSNARLLIQGNQNSSDALVTLDSDQDLADLVISSDDIGRQGLDLSSPLSAGAFHSLRVHAADLSASKASLYAAMQQAHQTAGDGIYDSSLASHSGSSLGLASVAGGYVLIRPTRLGDVNLDGVVTISDFIELSSNFGRTGVTWQEGDVNYDGSVTISDFINLAANFGASYAGQTTPVSAADQLTLASFAAAHGVAVPEPAAICVLLSVSLATLRRRRLQSTK